MKKLIFLINVIILQWFFLRVIRKEIKLITSYKLKAFNLMPNGNISSMGEGKYNTMYKYKLKFGILPFKKL